MDEEIEYRVPARVLTNRDPIILNRLSLREFFQWVGFFVLVYLSFNLLPLDFTFKLIIGASVATFGALFIHAPINGLAGIEWVYIYIRFGLEKKRHLTVAPFKTDADYKPVFSVSMSMDGTGRRSVVHVPDFVPSNPQSPLTGKENSQDANLNH